MKEKLLVEVWELQLGHSLHIESKVRAIKWLKQPNKLVSRWKLLRFDTGTALASLITVAGADTDDASTWKNLQANRPFTSFSMLYFSLFSHAQIKRNQTLLLGPISQTPHLWEILRFEILSKMHTNYDNNLETISTDPNQYTSHECAQHKWGPGIGWCIHIKLNISNLYAEWVLFP